MKHNVEILPSKVNYECEADETLLSSALNAGVILPYGCKNGVCGSCKSEIVEGKVDYGHYQQKALPDEEKAQGKVLTCCAKPLSAVVLKARALTGLGDFPVLKMPCRVNSIEFAAPDVAILTLQLPANQVFQFNAGQYIEFILSDGIRRSYSMANPPSLTGKLELHIRHMPGGVFTDTVFSTLKARDILRLEGPLGAFFLRQSDKPVVLLASGTGFAPIKSLLEDAFEKQLNRQFIFYWGARTKPDLYLLNLVEQWQQQYEHFKFIPVLSAPTSECHWQGRTGFVHHAVMADFPNLAGYQVYACGAPIVIRSALADFTKQCGLPEEEFYADSFTSLADIDASSPK